MKKIVCFLFVILFSAALYAQDSLNMTLLARWDDDTLPLASPGNLNLQYSGCWGMVVNNHEFAIIGGALHVFIFDVTDPKHPLMVGKFAGQKNTVWREFKSYRNRLYAVSDATQEGMMIIDMSAAPTSIKRVYYSNEFFNSSHTITLDTLNGHIYLNGTNVVNNGSLILDVSQNPDKPTLVASVAQEGGYIHDSYVRHDTLYASSGYNGLYVYDMTNPLVPKTLGSVATGGYNHLSWVTKSGDYAYYTEEIPKGRPIEIVNLKNLTNGDYELVGSFLDNLTPNAGNFAVPHNIYIKDDLLFDSQYEDGLLIYDISTPKTPVLVGHYDTHPENTVYNGYFGCWGNYPWLPSGTIIASDMQNGLILMKRTNVSATHQATIAQAVQIFPNPASGTLNIQTPENTSDWSYRLLDLSGKCVRNAQGISNAQQSILLNGMNAGLYFIEIQFNSGVRMVQKVVVE
jgi:choice-of-anchor B domain-containing protein